MQHVQRWVLVSFGLLLSMETCDAAPPEAALFEPAPTFRTSDLLPAAIIKGPNYELAEFVTVESFKLQFQIKTEWGTLPAAGWNMLELRLRELYAIENARQLARDPQFVKGVFEAVNNTPEGVKILLTEPQGAILRVPKGFERLIRSRLDPADRKAGSETRRRLAVEVGCDPETSNPILKQLLDSMALRKGLGSLATKAGLSLAVPGLGLLPTTADIKELIATKAPHEIQVLLNQDLAKLGIGEASRQKFVRESNYTTTQKLLFVQQLQLLAGTRQLTLVVDAANEAANEAESLAILQELRLLNELRKRNAVVEISYPGLLLAHLEAGELVLISSADYLYSCQTLADGAAAFREQHPAAPTRLLLSGGVTPRARELLGQSRITIYERE